MDVEDFIATGGVDEKAANALRELDPALQKQVIDRGDLTGRSNPSATLMSRIKDSVKSGGQQGSAYLKMEVEQFIIQGGVDERAAQCLRVLDPQSQTEVLARGALGRNPSATLMSRISKCKSSGRQSSPAQAGVTDDLMAVYQQYQAMGFLPMTGFGGVSGGIGGGIKPTQGVKRKLDITEFQDVETFIAMEGVDERAAAALRSLDAETQQQVMARGSMADRMNKSATLMGRIRDAAPSAAQGAAFSSPSFSQDLPVGDVEQFILLGGVDERAAQCLRELDPASQMQIMERGDLGRNPSAVLMSRIKNLRGSSQGGMMGMGGGGFMQRPSFSKAFSNSSEPTMSVEDFIVAEGIDEKAANELRELDPEVQNEVIGRGSMAGRRNPSATLSSRIRDAKVACHANESVETFIVTEGVDEAAAGALRDLDPDLQEQVVARGTLAGTRNPSATLLGRIKQCKNTAFSNGAGKGKGNGMGMGMMMPSGFMSPMMLVAQYKGKSMGKFR